MINSNPRKLRLSGWLKENGSSEYNSPLKLQKFLLFYEMFSKIEGDEADFSSLKGYKKGPVFSNVWGDYTHEKTAFDTESQNAYQNGRDKINQSRAEKSHFLVTILNLEELSSLTHELNIWKSKEARIMSGEQQVSLKESDFNDNDEKIIKLLEEMYPASLIKNSRIIQTDRHSFIFSKKDATRLTAKHFDILCTLSNDEQLENPVYADIDEEGRLIID